MLDRRFVCNDPRHEGSAPATHYQIKFRDEWFALAGTGLDKFISCEVRKVCAPCFYRAILFAVLRPERKRT